VLLHDAKVEVWYEIHVWRVIWHVLFHKAITCKCYVRLILSLLFNELTDKEKIIWAFMQDNAAVHTASSSLDASHEVFGKWFTNQGLWPPWSPDLNACDFCLWDMLNNPYSLEEPQDYIRHEIFTVPIQQIHHVPTNIFSWHEAYL
jgi:hypothetical protein